MMKQIVSTRRDCDHTNLVRRPEKDMTPEQAWCGTWYDCPAKCGFSTLIMSDELQEQHEQYARSQGYLSWGLYALATGRTRKC